MIRSQLNFFVLCTSKDLDEDSEAEKLSPLLVSEVRSPEQKSRMNSAEDTDEVRSDI